LRGGLSAYDALEKQLTIAIARRTLAFSFHRRVNPQNGVDTGPAARVFAFGDYHDDCQVFAQP
jgi:hypothetical protein